ncbi:MAG: primosomal protein N' [Chloroflexota bacterium]
MRYANVAVNAPTAWPRTFTYSLPSNSTVSVGSAVWVPFGRRSLQGIVFELSDYSPVEETKRISRVIGSKPLLSERQVELARWISHYYLAPYFSSTSLMLPPGFERRLVTFVEPVSNPPEKSLSSLTSLQKKTLNFLQKHGRIEARQLKKKVPQKSIDSTVNQLARKGLVVKTAELAAPKVRPKMVPYIRLAVDIDRARENVGLLEKKAFRQAELLKLLVAEGEMPLSEARNRAQASPEAAKALERKGLVAIKQFRVRRDPLADLTFSTAERPTPTPPQQAAIGQITEALHDSASETSDASSPTTFLLHGVTGSGKTEVYLRALEETVSLGKKGIVLVPEISLTPQTISRFASRFPGRVAVLHSGLSIGEQFDEWHRIRDGEFDVVIGSRSAIFAPQPDLGLIVIDEEHEWTYKQHDQIPLYHSRNVALKLGELTGAVLVLGSATPDLESYYRAQRGDYRLLELPERVGRSQGKPYPPPRVQVIDMRRELKSGNRSIFSRRLIRSTGDALAAGEQVILFLNRRGTNPFVQCRDCGHVMRCRSCEVALTYHAREDRLICHQCGYSVPPPETCPECESKRMKFLGTGTQRVEEEVAKLFPEARTLRWDRDVTKRRASHGNILRKFESHEADILVGTQMIAKGLDIPLVTVVGVVNADLGLYFPDFRAGERAFQLILQVMGRAGRGIRGGRVIIQTFTPEHYAIIAAAEQDYLTFYEQEAAFRHYYGYPPFNRLARLLYTHTNVERCQDEAARMIGVLRDEKDSQGLANTSLIGPSPAYTERIRGRYRWQIVIRGPDPTTLLSQVPIPQGWTVDIDPVGLA